MPPYSQERHRKACDKCHQQKLSCKKTGSGDKCERCHRLKRPCTSSPPLRNQRNNSTRRNPREHESGRRRPKTLAILPRTSTATATTTTTTTNVMPLSSNSSSNSSSSSSSSSSSLDSSPSQGQDSIEPVIPVMSESLVTEAQDQQQQQYMERVCWPGYGVTAAEFSDAATFPPYFAPSWPDGEDEAASRMDFLVGGDYPDNNQPSPPPPHDIIGVARAATCGFSSNLGRDLDSMDDGNSVSPPPGAYAVQSPSMVAAAAAPATTSLVTRDPASICDDLDQYNNACFSTIVDLGPGLVQSGGGGYRLSSRIRLDWQAWLCTGLSFQGEVHPLLGT